MGEVNKGRKPTKIDYEIQKVLNSKANTKAIIQRAFDLDEYELFQELQTLLKENSGQKAKELYV